MNVMEKESIEKNFKFERYCKGPYSQLLAEQIEQPQHYPDVYTLDRYGIHLTSV